MSDGTPKAAKPSGAGRRKGRTTAGCNAVARARGGRGRRLWWLAPAAIVAVALAMVIAVTKSGHSQREQGTIPTLKNPPATTAVGRDTPPPWNAPADAAAAVRAAGLPMLSREGTVIHIHAHLDVSVDGQAVEVPAGIGIDRYGRGIIALIYGNPQSAGSIPSRYDFPSGL